MWLPAALQPDGDAPIASRTTTVVYELVVAMLALDRVSLHVWSSLSVACTERIGSIFAFCRVPISFVNCLFINGN